MNPLSPGDAASAVLLLCVVALTLQGVFRETDNAVRRTLSSFRDEVSRWDGPLVLDLDDPFVARFGPPPWGAKEWIALDRALELQGIERALVVEPWPTVMRERVWLDHIVLPAIDVEGAVVPSRAAPTQVVPLDASLDLDRGEFVVPQHDTPWLPCSDANCLPGERVPLAVQTAATIPAVDLLDADQPIMVAPNRLVLIGLTAEPWAVQPLFVDGAYATRAEILARLSASGVGLGGTRFAPTWAALAWVFAGALAGLLLRRKRPWLVLLGALSVHFMTWVISGLWLPWAPTIVVLVGPRFLATLVDAQSSSQVLRRVGLLVSRGVPDEDIAASKLRTLGDLVGSVRTLMSRHAHGRPWGVFLLRGEHRLELVANHGLAPASWEVDSSAPILFEALGALFGSRVDGIVPGSKTPFVAFPVRQNGEPIALWVVAMPDGGRPTDRRRFLTLARWISRRMALEEDDLPDTRSTDARSHGEDRALSRILGEVAEDGARWRACLDALPSPAFVTDVAGDLVLVNEPMSKVLVRSGLGGSPDLQQILARTKARVAAETLFSGEGSVRVPLGRWVLDVRPVVGDAGEILGFVGAAMQPTWEGA